MQIKNIPAWYYQQFHADHTKEIPAHGYGGWKKTQLDFDWDKTALIVMHAWDCKTQEDYPGWYRSVEYIPRAQKIGHEVFPPLLKKARKDGLAIIHVVHEERMVKNHLGYQKTQQILEDLQYRPCSKSLPNVEQDKTLKDLKKFRQHNVFVGKQNQKDVEKGFEQIDFMTQAKPLKDECIVKDSDQLHAVCLHHKVNHLIYVGFAINWCLQYSPGNMNDMSDRGCLVSTIKEAVTAVENKESAGQQQHKAYGLWVTALKNGFVFDLDDFLSC